MAKRIDINDWVLSGAGGAGISFFHKSDPDLMLKIDNRTVSEEELQANIGTAKIVYDLGLPTPEPGEVVTDGERFGQTFRRIHGKVSYARLCGEQPESIPQLAHEYCEVVKKLHSTIGAGTGLRSIKEVYGALIQGNSFRSQEIRDKALRLLESLPDGDTCVHGDLHFGNLIKADGKAYLIDLGNFGYGSPLFDIAMMLNIKQLSVKDTEIFMDMMHCTPEQADLFWDCFRKEYFGENATDEEIFKKVGPYMIVRFMTMETEAGHPLPPHAIGPILQRLEAL